MKKTHPLLLWILMWVLGDFMIIVRNKITTHADLELRSLIYQNIILDTIVVPIALVGFFIMKIILKAVGFDNFFEGQSGLKNIIIVWFVLYILVFLFPLFRR